MPVDDPERAPAAANRLVRDVERELEGVADARAVEVERHLSSVVIEAGHARSGGGAASYGQPAPVWPSIPGPSLPPLHMTLSFDIVKKLAVKTSTETIEDDVPSLAAAIAYYTIFSLPPLLVIVVAVAGAVFGPQAVREALTGQVGSMIGPGAASAIDGMIASAGDLGSGVGSKIAGIVALLFGATGAFGQLQKSVNRAWEVEEEAAGGIVHTILKRLVSFGLILTIAFLLLVSLAVSAAVAAIGSVASEIAPSALASVGIQVANLAVSLGVTTLLFAAMFKWLPDAVVAWKDLWVGAFVTALLFTLGKTAIGIYLGRADPGSAFGAAGSLALILIWIYYSALILLVGAEFTQAWAEMKGAGIEVDSEDDAEPQADEPQADTPTTSAPSSPGFSIEDAASGRTRG